MTRLRRVARVHEIERLEKWIDDLQSGMWINCVYCGHRYGPDTKPPTVMREALNFHISVCPKHPLSIALLHKAALIAVLKECERYFVNRPGNWETQLYERIAAALAKGKP